jgi:hypothetical protein
VGYAVETVLGICTFRYVLVLVCGVEVEGRC